MNLNKYNKHIVTKPVTTSDGLDQKLCLDWCVKSPVKGYLLSFKKGLAWFDKHPNPFNREDHVDETTKV